MTRGTTPDYILDVPGYDLTATTVYNCTDRYVLFTNQIYGTYNTNAGEISNMFRKIDYAIWSAPNTYPWSFTVNTGQLHFVVSNVAVGITENTTQADRTALIKAWMDANKPEFVVKLATPIEYQLTPMQLKAFKDQNHIWSDLNGNTTVTYWTH